MNQKEELINSLVIKLADRTDMSVNELKSLISIGMYDYSIDKMETTALSCGDGSVTDMLWRYFELGKLSTGLQEESLQRYKEVVYQLYDFTHKEINMITTEDISVFLYQYKHMKKIQDSTMHSKRLYLNSFYSYLFKHKKISYNPMDLIDPIKCIVKVKKPLTEYETEKIKMACEKLPRSANRNIAMINFMLDSGVRVSELCGIKMSNVDFLHNKVLILGKGNKERYVYFSDRTKARLEVYFRDRNDMDTNDFNELCFKYSDLPLFASCDKHCRCMNKGSVESMLKTIGKNAGIERLHPHLLRATFATNLAKRGVSTSAIAKALGHANLNTIHRYILLSDDQVSTSLRSVGFGS